MTDKPELLPCPFCGGAAEIEDGRNDQPWVVQCIDIGCPAQPFVDYADTRKEAIAAWNTRATPQPDASALVEALRAVKEAYGESENARFDAALMFEIADNALTAWEAQHG